MPIFLIGLGNSTTGGLTADAIGAFTGRTSGDEGISGLALEVGALMPARPIRGLGSASVWPAMPLRGRPPVAPQRSSSSPKCRRVRKRDRRFSILSRY